MHATLAALAFSDLIGAVNVFFFFFFFFFFFAWYRGSFPTLPKATYLIMVGVVREYISGSIGLKLHVLWVRPWRSG